MYVCACVLVNNSHLFIGLKLYTMKASLTEDVLFSCQKEKLKKRMGEGLLEIFLPSHCLCLSLLMINDSSQLCFEAKHQRGEEIMEDLPLRGGASMVS